MCFTLTELFGCCITFTDLPVCWNIVQGYVFHSHWALWLQYHLYSLTCVLKYCPRVCVSLSLSSLTAVSPLLTYLCVEILSKGMCFTLTELFGCCITFTHLPVCWNIVQGYIRYFFMCITLTELLGLWLNTITFTVLFTLINVFSY